MLLELAGSSLKLGWIWMDGRNDGVVAAEMEEGRIKERTSLGRCVGDNKIRT